METVFTVLIVAIGMYLIFLHRSHPAHFHLGRDTGPCLPSRSSASWSIWFGVQSGRGSVSAPACEGSRNSGLSNVYELEVIAAVLAKPCAKTRSLVGLTFGAAVLFCYTTRSPRGPV